MWSGQAHFVVPADHVRIGVSDAPDTPQPQVRGSVEDATITAEDLQARHLLIQHGCGRQVDGVEGLDVELKPSGAIQHRLIDHGEVDAVERIVDYRPVNSLSGCDAVEFHLEQRGGDQSM